VLNCSLGWLDSIVRRLLIQGALFIGCCVLRAMRSCELVLLGLLLLHMQLLQHSGALLALLCSGAVSLQARAAVRNMLLQARRTNCIRIWCNGGLSQAAVGGKYCQSILPATSSTTQSAQ
jgi:hypothetical protein